MVVLVVVNTGELCYGSLARPYGAGCLLFELIVYGDDCPFSVFLDVAGLQFRSFGVASADGFCSFVAFLSVSVVLVAGLAGSGPFAELLLVNSSAPCANRHLSPYLHWPFSRQFLHISYLRRLTTATG